MTRATITGTLACLMLAGLAGPLWAQEDQPELRLDGLLRTGLRLESRDAGGVKGFEIYDARLGLTGRVGIIFDYAVRAEYDFDDDKVRLLDASLSFPIRDELLRLDAGILKSSSGLEAMLDKGELQLVERAQAALALSPGRQLGFDLRGRAFEGRFRYWGGMFNGNGPAFENDDNSFLFAFRGEYNTVGDVEFFEDLVLQAGADVAFADDSALAVLPVATSAGAEESSPGGQLIRFAEFTGSRVIWGADLAFRYLNYSLLGEYTRADYDPTASSSESLASEGYYIEGGYTLWGALDFLARYDSFKPAAGLGIVPKRNQFLIFGLNLYPGFHAKIGFQYAVGLDDTLLGPSESIDGTNTGPALAHKQFLLNMQVAF
jgi:hypothetical protein